MGSVSRRADIGSHCWTAAPDLDGARLVELRERPIHSDHSSLWRFPCGMTSSCRTSPLRLQKPRCTSCARGLATVLHPSGLSPNNLRFLALFFVLRMRAVQVRVCVALRAAPLFARRHGAGHHPAPPHARSSPAPARHSQTMSAYSNSPQRSAFGHPATHHR
jgi:hypothetical protein